MPSPARCSAASTAPAARCLAASCSACSRTWSVPMSAPSSSSPSRWSSSSACWSCDPRACSARCTWCGYEGERGAPRSGDRSPSARSAPTEPTCRSATPARRCGYEGERGAPRSGDRSPSARSAPTEPTCRSAAPARRCGYERMSAVIETPLRAGALPAGRRNGQIALVAVVLVVACALPFLLGNYRVFQLTLAWSYAIALLGLNMLTGYNGQISLGHGAFYAIGAYVAAILMDKLGLPYWATIPISGAVCFVVGFLFGLPALRLEGLYLALATFALAVATPQILKYKLIEDWTGGV